MIEAARYFGIDEKAFHTGQDYMANVCGLISITVEYVAEKCKGENFEGNYRQFSLEQLERIKAVIMDLWELYFKATLKLVPGAAE